jgi:hypothetical protein
MGMHIWYALKLGEEATFEEAIEKIAELRRYAGTVGFRGAHDLPPVGELETGDGTEAWPPTYIVKRNLGKHREQSIAVPAIEWVGFPTMPGKGTESAYFGLARYPAIFRPTSKQSQIITVTKTHFDGSIEPDPTPLDAPAEEVVVDARGWSSWSGWCKTQYAHRHGLDHFMHCHLALIKLLDYAKALGILDYVHDDGGYWDTRSADVLVANLRENDRIVAAVVGALSDQIGEALEDRGYVAVAPIQAAPDFEHLEAEGIALLNDRAGARRAEPAPIIASGIASILQAADDIRGASILPWPAIDLKGRWPPLAESIEGMQRLNPELGLRIVRDDNGISYLGHARSSQDVFEIVMPYRVPDKLTSPLTQLNEQRRRIRVDGRWVYIDATRIERTATGSLLVRPCSAGVRISRLRIGKAFAAHFGADVDDRVYPGWCLLPDADGEEFFEFEWSYWPRGMDATAARRPDGTYRRDREYWSVLPGGFIGIRDRYDISRSDFESRCRKAVAMGVSWCVLIDQERQDLSVFRADDIERVTSADNWRLRELPELAWSEAWLRGL